MNEYARYKQGQQLFPEDDGFAFAWLKINDVLEKKGLVNAKLTIVEKEYKHGIHYGLYADDKYVKWLSDEEHEILIILGATK